MKALDDVDRLPRLAAAEQRRWKADRVKRHIVLAEKLQVRDVLWSPPPASPIAARGKAIRPFLRRGEVVDWSVEPDVEDFSFEPRTRHRDAPGEIARNAAITQVCGQPAACQRGHPGGPAFAMINPFAQSTDEQGLPEEEMATAAELKIAIT